MLTRLEVPEDLHRNAPRVAAAGYELSGETLINLVLGVAGIADLRGVDLSGRLSAGRRSWTRSLTVDV